MFDIVVSKTKAVGFEAAIKSLGKRVKKWEKKPCEGSKNEGVVEPNYQFIIHVKDSDSLFWLGYEIGFELAKKGTGYEKR